MSSLLTISEWETPCKAIPAQSKGKFHIKKRRAEVGTFLDVNAMSIEEALFTAPIEVTVLKEGKLESTDTESVWMSDSPMEYFQMYELVGRTKSGNVLVGGLGLGLLCHLLRNRRDIGAITVVEIEQDIIDMVAPYLPANIEVVHGDFIYEVQKLERAGRDYQTVIADLWKNKETGEELFEDCRIAMGDAYPEATHLYWAFQEDVDDENSRYAMFYLKDKGLLRVPQMK